MAEPEVKTPQQTLADAYALDEDVALELTPSQPAAVASPEPVVKSPPKDPVTGRFIKPDDVPPATQTYDHPERLKRLALEAGFEPDDIAGIDPVSLERSVNLLALKSLREAKQIKRDQTVSNAVDRNLANQNPPQPQVDEDPLSDYDFGEENGQKLGADFFHPALQNVIKKQAKELKELKKQVAALTGREVARENETRFQMYDRVFADSGFEDHFGKGPGKQFKAEDGAMQKRVAMIILSRTMSGPDEEAKLREAIKTVYGSRAQATPKNDDDDLDLSAAQQQWQQARLNRPTQRKELPPTKGKNAAVRAVTQKLNDFGAEGVNGDVEPEDFPD